jgi:hypothetical protein
MKLIAIAVALMLATGLAPRVSANPGNVEGCHQEQGHWVYQDGSPCRGTGEEPVTDWRGIPICANGRWTMIQGWRVTCIDRPPYIPTTMPAVLHRAQ